MPDYLFSLDLTLYCKIRNSPAFGGVGTTGYCTILIDDIQNGEDEYANVTDAIIRNAHQAQREMVEDFEITTDDFDLLTKEQFIEESGIDLEMDDDDILPCGCCACCGCSCEDYMDEDEDQTSLFDELESCLRWTK